MPLGEDKQYNLSWEERDKINRRLELKHRLKLEGIRKKWDPFLQIKKVPFSDPAVDRYMDMRKTGRMPNAPFKPSLFFSLIGLVFIPFGLVSTVVYYNRRDFLQLCSTGDIPYKDRMGKSIT